MDVKFTCEQLPTAKDDPGISPPVPDKLGQLPEPRLLPAGMGRDGVGRVGRRRAKLLKSCANLSLPMTPVPKMKHLALTTPAESSSIG